MPTPRIKLSCIGILDRCTVPQAILIGDVRIGKEHFRYVLLDEDIRNALSRMRDAVQKERSWGYNDVLKNRACGSSFPGAIRTHAFDSCGLVHDGSPLSQRVGTWSNGEPLWIRTDIAENVLADFDTWRELNLARADAIWAPNWLCLVGVQALALAADLPMPQPCGMGLDHPEVSSCP